MNKPKTTLQSRLFIEQKKTLEKAMYEYDGKTSWISPFSQRTLSTVDAMLEFEAATQLGVVQSIVKYKQRIKELEEEIKDNGIEKDLVS